MQWCIVLELLLMKYASKIYGQFLKIDHKNLKMKNI